MKFIAVSQDKSVINLLTTEFKNKGYVTFEAANLSELEKIQNTENFDVIVAEHILPDGNFFDYYDKLKSSTKNFPVAIVLSSLEDSLTSEIAFAMGVYAIFKKPFQIKNLYDSVEDATFSRREGLLRRQDERVQLICRLEFKPVDQTNWHFIFSNNISFGGFFAVTWDNIPQVNTLIDFKLKFTEKIFIEGVARVAWSRSVPKNGEQVGFGVQFCEGREKYVQILVPIINEARTRQNETSVFQKENLVSLVIEAIQLAKIKIAKSKTKFVFEPEMSEIFVGCRYPKMLIALSELLFHVASALKEINESKCELKIVKGSEYISLIITSVPGGDIQNIKNILDINVDPIFKEHQITLKSDLSSLSSIYTIDFPIIKS